MMPLLVSNHKLSSTGGANHDYSSLQLLSNPSFNLQQIHRNPGFHKLPISTKIY